MTTPSFENIKQFTRTDDVRPFWMAERPMTEEWKDQVFFLNNEGTRFIDDYFEASKMVDNYYEGVSPLYFKTIDTILVGDDSQALKKWLYHRQIPFDRYVFLTGDIQNLSHYAAFMMTWKMVLKYCEDLFFGHDFYMFDQTLNWCIDYHHESVLRFGTDKIYDKAHYERKTEINEALKRQFGLN